MVAGAVKRHRAVQVGGEADAGHHGDGGVAIGGQWGELCGGSAPDRDRAGERGKQAAATGSQLAVAVKPFGVVVAHGSTDEEAMPRVAQLEFPFLLAIDAIGSLDIGLAEGSIPGAVAIGAEEVGGHLSQSSELETALDASPVAAVVEEVITAETADVGVCSDFGAVIPTDQLRLKTEQVPWIDVAAAIDSALHHHLRLKAELGICAECDRFEVATDEQAIAVVIVDTEHPAIFNFLFLLNQLPAADGHGQTLLNDQPVATR